MTLAVGYTHSGAGMHWWSSLSYSTYEIENFGFPYIGVMQCWMTDIMPDDGISRLETWDWYPWAMAIDLPLSVAMILSTGVVAERLRRSRGQASMAGILAITTTIAGLIALWLNAPALLAWMRSGPPYVLQFNNLVYIDMPGWLLVTWAVGIVCTIDTLVLTGWKGAAGAVAMLQRSSQ